MSKKPCLSVQLFFIACLCSALFTSQAFATPDGPSNEMPLVHPLICHTVHADSVVNFFQGNRKDYNSIGADRSNPQKAIGAPQNNDTTNFVSLGFGGGFITLAFQHAIVNGPGLDLHLKETSFNSPSCDNYPERAKVYAAQNLTDWILLGEICQDGSVDLGPLQWAKYVRIEDISDRTSAKFDGETDAFDVDGISGSYCPRLPVLPIFECLTNDYDENGIPDGYQSAVFGYHNLNLHSVDIAFSAFNTFTTAPEDRGQDIHFIPGRKVAAFATPIDNSSITWSLQFPLAPLPQFQATASPTSRKRCSTFLDPEKVRPIFECSLPGEGNSFTGYFGYLNENSYPVEIPAGSNTSSNANKFSPLPLDRGQPDIFESGRVYGAFGVTSSDGGNQVWTLEYENTGSRTATAGAAGRQCASPYPTLNCVERLADASYRARFGYTNPEAFPLTIAAGALNNVAPGNVNQGQPETFLPGTHADAYQPIFASDESKTWTVQGAAITANATDEQLRCEPVEQPDCSILFQSNPGDQLQASAIVVDIPSTTVACGGYNTNVPLFGEAIFQGASNLDPSLLEYKWEIICDDTGATIANDDTLTPTVTFVNPGTEVQGTGAGTAATCKVVLTVTHDDPLSTPAVCEATISVDPCNFDCAGTIDGTSTLDECGMCDGDNSSCSGCDGIPNSGLVLDNCGECGGDGSTCIEDCAGVPGGSATFDRCGICEGDGESCLGCEETEILKEQYALDGGAHAQRTLINGASRLFVQAAVNKKAARRKARKARRAGEKLYLENWSLAWSVPATVQSCTNSAFCTQTNQIGSDLDAYNKNSEALREIALDLIKKIKPRGIRSIKKQKAAFRKRARSLHESNLTNSALVPRTDSVCSDPVGS